MKIRRPRAPPSSSHSHCENLPPPINVEELASRINPQQPLKSSQTLLNSSSQSHISLLPPEILTEIFEYCIPQEQFPIPSSTEAPLLLTHISGRWRALSLSLPNLWKGVHINYKDATEDIPAANAYLSRSGDKPLALSIAIDFAEQPQQEILDALCKHSKRWKHIRFEFRHLLCPPMYSLDQALDNVPELSTFEFHARDISNINVSPITHLLCSAPKLREITWVDDLADIDTLLKLPLGRLTCLSLSMDHGTLDYLQVLKECNNLEHIRITRPLSPILQPQAPLHLFKLASLNISSDVLGILDSLVLPALREIRIYGDNKQCLPRASGHSAANTQPSYHPHPAPQLPSSAFLASTGAWDITALLSLIDRSACAITSLSVSPPMTEHMLLVCLHRMSDSLVKLSIDGVAVGDALLEAITCRPSVKGKKRGGGGRGRHACDIETIAQGGLGGAGVDVLCPRLEELNLDARVGSTQGVLASMVESRVVAMRGSCDGLGLEKLSKLSIDDIDSDVDVVSPFRKIRVVDGHKDLERLKELSVLSRRRNSVVAIDARPYMRRSWTEGDLNPTTILQTRGPLTEEVVRQSLIDAPSMSIVDSIVDSTHVALY